MSSKAERKAERKDKALAKINAYIAFCLRQADRKTGAARKVYLDHYDYDVSEADVNQVFYA